MLTKNVSCLKAGSKALFIDYRLLLKVIDLRKCLNGYIVIDSKTIGLLIYVIYSELCHFSKTFAHIYTHHSSNCFFLVQNIYIDIG